MTRRAENYEVAVAWVAENDEPGADWALDVDRVAEMITVALVADLYDLICLDVAEDVIEYRKEHGGG